MRVALCCCSALGAGFLVHYGHSWCASFVCVLLFAFVCLALGPMLTGCATRVRVFGARANADVL